jgi:serine/threonine-protein kinase RsbW
MNPSWSLHHPPPPTPAPEYEIRRFRPEDALDVRELTERIYGETYTVPEMYHPEQIVQLNQAEELITVVARDPAGGIAGMADLDRRHHDSVAEVTDAMVLPAHRHHHLYEQMRAVLEGEADRLQLAGVFGMPVTNHLFSQKAEEHFGAHPVGVVLASEPATFHNADAALPQRMSEVLYFKYLRRPERIRVHVPGHHRDMCGQIYARLGVAVEFREPGPPAESGKVHANYLPEEQWGLLRVHCCGADTAAKLQRLHQQLCSCCRVDALYLELPLVQAGTPEVCHAAEEAGFFFSAIGPSFLADGDVLRLQWLNVPLDTSLLQIENPFARELVAYIDAERRRLGHGANGRGTNP